MIVPLIYPLPFLSLFYVHSFQSTSLIFFFLIVFLCYFFKYSYKAKIVFTLFSVIPISVCMVVFQWGYAYTGTMSVSRTPLCWKLHKAWADMICSRAAHSLCQCAPETWSGCTAMGLADGRLLLWAGLEPGLGQRQKWNFYVATVPVRQYSVD